MLEGVLDLPATRDSHPRRRQRYRIGHAKDLTELSELQLPAQVYIQNMFKEKCSFSANPHHPAHQCRIDGDGALLNTACGILLCWIGRKERDWIEPIPQPSEQIRQNPQSNLLQFQ